MKTSKSLFAMVFGSVLFAGLFFGAANAQNMQPILPSLDKFKIRVNNQDSANQTSTGDLQTTFDNLIAKAQENGSVKVIVGFRLDNYKSDAELSKAAQTRQREEIKQKQASLLGRLNNFNVTNDKQFDYIPFLAMEISADALVSLRNSGEIISIQEDEMQFASLLQSIPLIGGSAPGGATGGTFGGFSGAGRTVAVLDTGVDRFHAFFNGRVVSEACYSTTSGTTTSFCPGGASSSTAVNSGLNCDVNQIEGCFHGTHVAGIAAGGNPAITGNGVARNANIIAIQVFSRSTNCSPNPSPCTTAFTSDTILGLERVYVLRTTFTIDSVNLSLGGGQYFATCDTEQAAYKTIFDNLRAAGIASVVASGNESHFDSMASPACVSSAISIGSTNDGDVLPIDTVSSFSNSVYFLSLLAPGELITSSYPGGFYYDTQGTSMAAPHVAGAWAVMKQKFPSDTVTQTFTRLKYSGIQVLDTRNGLVKPRLKLDTALNTSNVDPCGTTAAITSGTPINGALTNTDCLLSLGNRTDIYTFTGTAGQGVAITHNSAAFDTYLYLVNSSGGLVAQDNNGGGGTNSRIPAGSGSLTLPASGTYYIYSTSFEGNKFGNYTTALTVTGGCNFTVSSSSQNFTASGGNGNFNVTTAAGCTWTAQSNAAWLTTTSTGNGNGAVNYTVAANPSATQRTATITTGGQVHTVTQAGAATTITHRPFDFDGDAKSDVSVFRPSNGAWYISGSQNGFYGLTFGLGTDLLAPADFDGDGKTDVAVFRGGNWYYLRSSNGTFVGIQWGLSNDIPLPADFDGDGKADVNVFRPSDGGWYRLNSSDNSFFGTRFGLMGDKPLIADFDGDGKSDITVFRSSDRAFYSLDSSTGTFRGAVFGLSTDIPTLGDYDGDGKTDVSVFRPSNGAWYRLNSSTGAFFGTLFGLNGDIPVPADYDGDGKTDIAVFRNGDWYYERSSNGGFFGMNFGFGTDRPIPAAF